MCVLFVCLFAHTYVRTYVILCIVNRVAVCRAAWIGEPPKGFANGGPEWIDDFFERFMKPLGTDDGWSYINESQHNLKHWQNRFWNGQAGYRRLMAVKEAYDPYNIFMALHAVGSDDSIIRFDRFSCTNTCRVSNTGCTNIPPSAGECAPRPSYVSDPGSGSRTPTMTCDTSVCTKTITVKLHNDGGSVSGVADGWNEGSGWWLAITPRGKCGPADGQPALLMSHSSTLSAGGPPTDSITFSGACAGAEYQLGVYFNTEQVRGLPCCTRGGFELFVDDVLIHAGVDYHTIYRYARRGTNTTFMLGLAQSLFQSRVRPEASVSRVPYGTDTNHEGKRSDSECDVSSSARTYMHTPAAS